MSYALAVDVGTSFTAAAVVRFHQGPSAVPECLPLGARGASVPSVVYFPEEGTVLVGEAAERRGLDSPERVAREFKRRIGDDVPIILGTLALQPEDVFATVARWVADRAAEREGGPASAVFLTHPAAWGSHRLSVIREALTAHGVENVTLLPEPEAAALHYASQVRVEEGSTIAVYDLGGGTFDTAVLRKAGSSRFELLGRPEGIEDLGGADFDAAVFSYVAAHTGNALADLDAADPTVLGALARLRRECVEAKEALSADSEASIPVLLPGVQQQVRLVRSEFEALIEEPVRETVDALEHSLAQLHLAPADLSTVLLIGGSSRIPLVAQVVSEELDRPIAVDADPKSSICLGAAVAALLAHTAAALETAEPAGTEPVETPASLAETVTAGAPPVVVPAVPPAPTGPAMPSWSRKYATAGAGPGQGAGRREWHGERGAHAPKPTVRITAVAAAAALLTVLTATAAQSPDGFGSLTAMFVPQAGASTEGGSTGPAAAGAGGTPTAGAPQPLAGIEASVRKPIGQEPGLDVSASPTTRQAPGGEAAVGGANPGGPAAAGGNPPPGTDAGATGTGIVPDSATVGPAMPPGTADPMPTDPAPVDTASPDTTTPTPTDSAPPTTTDPGTSSPSGTVDPSGSGTPTPDPGTSSPGTGETTPTVVPTTMAAPDPTGDPAVSPTADLTPTPAVAPSPTPEDTTASPIETAVATASTTSPGA